MEFRISSSYKPTGDQPEAIEQICNSIREGTRATTLMGVTYIYYQIVALISYFVAPAIFVFKA